MATEAPTLTTLQYKKAQKLIRDGQHQATDSWLLCASDTTVDAIAEHNSEDLILPLSCWLNAQELIGQRQGRTGVWLQSDERAHSLTVDGTLDVNDIPLIAVNFPVFSDGRGYTTARTLREALKYQGEMRAVGDVLRDQLFYMRRCGFSAYDLRDDQDLDAALSAFSDFQEGYQSSVDQPLPLFRRGRADSQDTL